MPEAIHYDIHSVCMYHSYYTYRKWQAELNLVTTSITLPAKVAGCKVNEIKSPAGTGFGSTPSKLTHKNHLNVYTVGYTHEVAYKRAGVPPVQEASGYKYVRV